MGFASQSGYNDNTEILTALDEREVTSYSYEVADKTSLDRNETYYIRLYGFYSSITYRGNGNNAGWYTRTGRNPIDLDDYTIYESVNLDVGGQNINSKNYELPINGNISLVVNPGSNITINQDVALLPGASITIDEGATCTMGTGYNMYV